VFFEAKTTQDALDGAAAVIEAQVTVNGAPVDIR
jgi:hypothetical protein